MLWGSFSRPHLEQVRECCLILASTCVDTGETQSNMLYSDEVSFHLHFFCFRLQHYRHWLGPSTCSYFIIEPFVQYYMCSTTSINGLICFIAKICEIYLSLWMQCRRWNNLMFKLSSCWVYEKLTQNTYIPFKHNLIFENKIAIDIISLCMWMDGKFRCCVVSSINKEGSKMNDSWGMAQLLLSTTCAQNIISGDDDQLVPHAVKRSTAIGTFIFKWSRVKSYSGVYHGKALFFANERSKSLELQKLPSSTCCRHFYSDGREWWELSLCRIVLASLGPMVLIIVGLWDTLDKQMAVLIILGYFPSPSRGAGENLRR